MSLAIATDPRLANVELTGAQWQRIERLAELNKMLKARVDPQTFQLICDAAALSVDIVLEQVARGKL